MIASPLTVKRGSKGYGLTLKSIRVYIGDSNDYRIHHIIEVSLGGLDCEVHHIEGNKTVAYTLNLTALLLFL